MRFSWVFVLLVGCAPSREGYLKEKLVGAAHGEFTSLDSDLRLAVCGWRPDTTYEGVTVSAKFVGDDKNGTGEADATFVPANGGVGCEGKIAFDYAFHPAQKAPAYYALTDVRRIGPASPLVYILEPKATPLALDAPAKATFSEAWKLPDGAFGVGFRVDITTAGPYRVAWTTPGEQRPRVIVYQKKNAVREGDSGGALGFWTLEPGPAWFFLHDARTTSTELRISSGK